MRTMRFIISTLLWICAGSFFLILGAVYLSLSLFFPPRRLQPLVRRACRILLLCAGQRLRIVGAFPSMNGGPYFYMFNHSSMLDTFIIISQLPEYTGAVGKKEQFTQPIWGAILKRWGAIPIDRENLDRAITSLNQAARDMDGGLSLLVAPEGTRSVDGRLGPFKKGPFHLANDLGFPIIPLGIRGAHRAKSKGSMHINPGIIEFHIGVPIDSEGSTSSSVESLRDKTRQAIGTLCGCDSESAR